MVAKKSTTPAVEPVVEAEPEVQRDLASVAAKQAEAAAEVAPTNNDEQARAAEKRAAAVVADPSLVEALLRERQGYIVRGLDDRRIAVETQIRLAGGTIPKG